MKRDRSLSVVCLVLNIGCLKILRSEEERSGREGTRIEEQEDSEISWTSARNNRVAEAGEAVVSCFKLWDTLPN